MHIICVEETHFDLEYFGGKGLVITSEIMENNANIKIQTYVNEMNSGVMNMTGNFTVLRFTGMLGMRNVYFTKEELLKMNAKLNRIKKPKVKK